MLNHVSKKSVGFHRNDYVEDRADWNEEFHLIQDIGGQNMFKDF